MKQLPSSTIVSSFEEIDFSTFTMPIITIYVRPSDFRESFVARIFDFDQWTPYAMVKPSLEAIREGIPAHLYRMDRMVGDDPAIVEVWL